MLRNRQLVICSDSPGWGGSEKSMLRVAGFLKEQVDLKFILSPFANKSLCDAVTETYGNYHTFFTPAAFPYMLWSLIRAAGLSMNHRKSVFLIWCHHPDSNRWLQLWLALSGRKFIVVERSVPSNINSFKRSRLSIPIKRFVISRAWCVVQPGWSSVAQYKTLFGEPKRKQVIPNSRPVDKISNEVAHIKQSGTKTFPYHGKVICTVGRLSHEKGLLSLIQAYSVVCERTQCSLLIVGEGPEEEALKEEVKRLALSYVFFSGYSSHIESYLAEADIFVLNSLLEGLPGALIEAMAAGLPCIATDIPGNRELIQHMKTGLQVPVDDVNALTSAILEYINNPTLAATLAKNAYNLVQQEYTIEQERKRWLQLAAEIFSGSTA